MKTLLNKSITFVLATSILCGTLFLTSCNIFNNTDDATAVNGTTESTSVADPNNNISTEDVVNPTETTENNTGNKPNFEGDTEKPEEVLVPGLYAPDSDHLLCSWDYLIRNKYITVKNSAITGSSNHLKGDLRIPDEIISISKKAFYGCTSLSGVYIGSQVSYIGDSAFYGCSGIKTLDIGSGVTKIGNSAFKYCTGLQVLVVGDKVTSIETSAFQGCTNLRYLYISDSVTFIGKSAFNGCSGLKTVYVGDSVTYVGESVFSGCTALEKVILPCGVSYIGIKAFYNCNMLRDVQYEGVDIEFDSITVEKSNGSITQATISYLVDIENEKDSLLDTINELVHPEVEESTTDDKTEETENAEHSEPENA